MAGWLAVFIAGAELSGPTAGAAETVKAQVVVVELEGVVEVARAGRDVWEPASTNLILRAEDRLRTGRASRAVVRLSEQSTLRMGDYGLLQMPAAEKGGFGLWRGLFYFFHRDKPGMIPVRTPTVATVIRGTEFNVQVDGNGRTALSLINGEVEMTNEFGRLALRSGEAGVVEPGQPPRPVPMIEAINIIQWALYYPAVLNPDDVPFTAQEREELRESMAALRSGDLRAALDRYPAGRQPTSAADRVYLAALLLGAGQVGQAEALLAGVTAQETEDRGQRSDVARVAGRLAEALRKVVAAVKFQPFTTPFNPQLAPPLATEFLAESYYQQSRFELERARTAAQRATELAPSFGLAWARFADLQFSFGRVPEARGALRKGLELSPRNAQAHALQGFLLSAENRIAQAIDSFEQAMALDGALGNAWLGRGLCRIRRNRLEEGRLDLQVAATLEPQRALLRSYLGKAFNEAGELKRAEQEIALAKKLDKNDPTAWLYSALVLQRQSRINEAVGDLERSQELNENRRLYRSKLLLDQDQAVRGANQANVYRDAGMVDVSVREAQRAVNTDYANFSSHLFLADSFNALRDPRQINLRYETPWLNEYLLANLLAPVGAGTLSPYITQQEYSKLFERDRFGVASSTEYYSQGDWVQTAAQYGQWRNSSYSADITYRSENGYRPNNDLEQLTGSFKFKQQITPADSVYGQVVYYHAEGGDVNEYYDPAWSNPGLRVEERQEPILLAGYHHEWAPGSHSLLLAGWLTDTYEAYNPQQQTLLLDRSMTPGSPDVIPVSMTQDYRSDLNAYTVEAQQIWEQPQHTIIFGGRFQGGELDTQNRQTHPVFPMPIPITFASDQTISSSFERESIYGYLLWRPWEPLLLVGGLSYDHLAYPENFRYAPISTVEETTGKVSPKAGFIWTPAVGTVVRGAYAQGLGGVGLDQSVRLEPSQVAGFNQSFRSIIPESVVGANAGAPFQMAGVSLEQRFPTRTYLALSGEWLSSAFDRSLGVFEFWPPVRESSTTQSLDYQERSMVFTANQLLGDEWSVGLRYRLSKAQLDQRFTDLATATFYGGVTPEQNLESVLHQVSLQAAYNHPSGFFAQAEALWTSQSNQGYTPARPGDDFWQINTFAGYRFFRRRAEVRLGVLNLTDQDYRLNTLNITPRLFRERTLVVSAAFSF